MFGRSLCCSVHRSASRTPATAYRCVVHRVNTHFECNLWEKSSLRPHPRCASSDDYSGDATRSSDGPAAEWWTDTHLKLPWWWPLLSAIVLTPIYGYCPHRAGRPVIVVRGAIWHGRWWRVGEHVPVKNMLQYVFWTRGPTECECATMSPKTKSMPKIVQRTRVIEENPPIKPTAASTVIVIIPDKFKFTKNIEKSLAYMLMRTMKIEFQYIFLTRCNLTELQKS